MTEEIAPGVYVSTAYPGINVGFIATDGGAVAVDAPPLPNDARAWKDHILEVADGPILYTILTDHHLDRSLSAGLLDAPVVAGRGAFEGLRESGAEEKLINEWAKQHPEVAAELEDHHITLPDVTISDRVVIHGSPLVAVERIAGSAPGSVWVLLREEGILFAGDTLVVGTQPFLGDAPDTRAWLKTLVKMRRSYFPADTLIPGWGAVCDEDGTQPLSEYIRRVRRRIRSVHTAGGDRSELAELVPEFLAMFPVEEGERERLQCRITAGLEQVYEELTPKDTA
jgi:glyoxylase-like metal-dependent hydrolase (beta-lactamase superfamily II)